MIKKIIILLVIVSLGIFLYFKFNKKQDTNNLTLYGNIEIRQVDVSFQVSGKIKEMFICALEFCCSLNINNNTSLEILVYRKSIILFP